MDEHTHEEMLLRIATLEEKVVSLETALGLSRRSDRNLDEVLDEALAVLPPSALTREGQDIVEQMMTSRSAYLDGMDHDRGHGG